MTAVLYPGSRITPAAFNRRGLRLHHCRCCDTDRGRRCGAVGALCLAAYKSALDLETLKDIARSAMATTSMVFLILIGAACFRWCLGASVAMN